MTSTVEDPNRLVDTVLGSRFEIKSLSAVDNAGATYDALDTEQGSMASVRVLHRIRPDDGSLRRLLELLTEVSSLEVQGIKRLRAIGRTRAKDVYYATDAVVGQALAQRLERGPLSPEDAATTLAEVGEILAQAHHRGVVHGALHPGAVVIPPKGSGGSVQLLDFGLGPLTVSLNIPGSDMTSAAMPYQSPEQAKAEAFDHRADIYALGALLYESLVGHPPFAGKSAFEVLALQLRGEAPSLAAIDARFEGSPLQQVIDHSMQVRLEDRYDTMQSMVMALRRAAQAEVTRKVRLAGPRPQTAPTVRGSPKTHTGKTTLPRSQPGKTKSPIPRGKTATGKTKAAVPDKASGGKAVAGGSPSRIWLLAGILAALLLTVGFVLWLVAPTLLGEGAGDRISAIEPAVAGSSGGPAAEQPAKAPRIEPQGGASESPEERAQDAVKAAIVAQAEPLNPRATKLVKEGNLALAEGRFPHAIKSFAAARRLAPHSPEVARGLGMAYLNRGDRRAAARELKRYLDLDPDAVDRSRIEATLRAMDE
jgi:serine/threonine protein kinase